MSRYTVRRTLALAALSSSAVLGLLAPGVAQAAPTAPPSASASPTAKAAPANDVRDRVLTSFGAGFGIVLVPDRSASGSPVRAVQRIGVAQATPVEQTWRRESSRVARGAFTLVHTPSVGAGRPLCLDVKGDSTAEGAPLVLRACDGTPSQAWRQLNSVPPTHLENQDSKLKMELVDGRLVQAQFAPRDAADARARNNAQLFSVGPKVVGVAGI